MNKAELFFATAGTVGDPMGSRRYPNADRIRKISNFSYGKDEKQKYDIFYSKADDKTKPVLVNVHGGGFLNGDKKYRDYLCGLFADSGWFVINTNYRLCPAVRLHNQISDIYSVLNKIPQLKEKYDIDDKKVVITGDSAGAYLAGYMEALLTNPHLRERYGLPETDMNLSGLLLYSGPYDLPKLLLQKIFLNMAKDIGASVTGIKAKGVNDIKKYEFFDTLALPKYVNEKWCPTMLSYSAKDVFTKGQGEHLQSVLSAHNVPAYAHTPNAVFANHNYHLFVQTPDAAEVLAASLKFLNSVKDPKKKKFTLTKQIKTKETAQKKFTLTKQIKTKETAQKKFILTAPVKTKETAQKKFTLHSPVKTVSSAQEASI